MIDVVVVGSIGLDNIKTPYGCIVNALGGAAIYSSWAASFFSKVGLVGIAGSDFPDEHLELLTNRGICIKGLTVSPGQTFRWEGAYENDMNQAITLKTDLNVLADFKPRLSQEYKKAQYFFLANNHPAIQLQVINQMSNPQLIVIDTMSYWIDQAKEQVLKSMAKANLVVLNDAEAKKLFNTHNLIIAGKKLLTLGPRAVIIKKGEHGALLFTKKGIFSAPAYPLGRLKDPTGAGDSFAGGLIGWLAKTKDLSERNLRNAVIYGTVVASFNTQGLGLANLQKITVGQIEKRFRRLKKIAQF
jgi:ribokinase